MKIFPVLCAVLVLIIVLPTLHAEAVEPKLMTKRHLLSKPASSLGRKAGVGAIDAKDANSNQGESGVESKTGSNADNGDSDDEQNPSYGSYGKASGSSPETHHYFPDDHRHRNF